MRRRAREHGHADREQVVEVRLRTWMNTKALDLQVWQHRLCIAVELNEHTLLYITEGGVIHVMGFGDEPIFMPHTWELISG